MADEFFFHGIKTAQVILDVGIDFDLPHSCLPVCASHKEDHLNKVCMRIIEDIK